MSTKKSSTYIYGKLPKALNERLQAAPDLATVTLSAKSLQSFAKDYVAYANATGFGAFVLEWFVDPKTKDLGFRIPHARHGIVIEAGREHLRYWFNDQKAGTGERNIIRTVAELFEWAHERVYGNSSLLASDGGVLTHLLTSVSASELRDMLKMYLAPVRDNEELCARAQAQLVREYACLAEEEIERKRKASHEMAQYLRKPLFSAKTTKNDNKDK